MSQPMIDIQFTYRGDDRDLSTVKKHGGFVPRYLLNEHNGGFDGYVSCGNKTDNKFGCNCAGFSEKELVDKSRTFFIKMLTQDPSILQRHVMFNNVGLMSTAIDVTDKFETAHGYRIASHFISKTSITEAEDKLGLKTKALNAFTDKIMIYMDAAKVEDASIIGVTPLGGVELSFVTPVPSASIDHL